MQLGIFDSGIGGEAIAQHLSSAFPDANIMTVNDRAHLPYGDRTRQDIQQLTDAAIQPLLGSSCDVIVLACNSASAASIEFLREKYPQQKFIGLEPMVKPATTISNTHVIAVCATPATLTSDRYHNLKIRYGSHAIILEPNCRDWARVMPQPSR